MARRARKTVLVKPPVADPANAKLFINRELSWLEFNSRVLDEARDSSVPLLERLKFLAIVASNLDEFFMIRVAGLKQQLSGNVAETPADGMTPAEQLAAISARAHAMVAEQYRVWRDEVGPGLERAGVRILRGHQLTPEQKAHLSGYFSREVWPVLTPLAVDPGHPFPMLANRSLNLAILLHREKEKVARRQTVLAVVQVPSVLKRINEVVPAAPQPQPQDGGPASAAPLVPRFSYMLLEDLIALHAGDLFPGFRVVGCSAFRVTRNSDLSIDEDEADDLLKTIQKELRRRERGSAVRLEIAHDTPAEIVTYLRQVLRLDEEDVYRVDGPIHLADLGPVASAAADLRELRDEPFSPQIVPPLQEYDDIFRVIGQRDILLQHPYESFEDVVEFISEAASDPKVLAIKQTLYRTSADSPIVRALIRAAENGKQVTAVVELKARFDEAPNIQWARALEDAGVHVVYGLIGLKTHCKVSLVVRREADKIKRYVHLSTGNYNPATARLYGDLSYFTARDAYADDAGALFNLLTGYSSPPSWKRFHVAPLGLQERIISLIDRETALGPRGRIIAKMNALVDATVIKALYRASQAGVQIDLIVRGICCLRPGVPGTSDNIRVTSIVDRFLEHARIFYFENGGKREVYLSSADWMPRNFQRRVEVMFPVDDEELRDRVVDEILAVALRDNVKARRLLSDGNYVRVRPEGDAPTVRSQYRFMELAREKAQAGPGIPGAGGGPYQVRTTPPPRSLPSGGGQAAAPVVAVAVPQHS
ncbi:MAG TPA: polyphosphate kinase 1 [Polyangia bacterium]|jgi:polyphosphate kinase|nr:polyphosphate kinase 1 [Polyangia bacterium]